MVYKIYLNGELIEEYLSIEDMFYTLRDAGYVIVDEDEDLDNNVIKLHVEIEED